MKTFVWKEKTILVPWKTPTSLKIFAIHFDYLFLTISINQKPIFQHFIPYLFMNTAKLELRIIIKQSKAIIQIAIWIDFPEKLLHLRQFWILSDPIFIK